MNCRLQDKCADAEDAVFRQHLEDIWQNTVKQNVAAALRNAITTARDAGHKVRYACMTFFEC
jgi:hypothetical protein